MSSDPATGSSLPPPFPAQPEETPWHWLPSTVLEKCFARFTTAAPFADMGIALVDLTHAPRDSGHANLITYAGWRDDHQFYAASLPKIVIILAAFRLLACVRSAAEKRNKTADTTDAKKLIDEITKAWSPIVSRRFPGRPADFPEFDRIFRIERDAGTWIIDFKRTFWDQMEGIVINDNAAANFCIDAIGFQYINGTLIHEGLFNEKTKRGLFLGGGYSRAATWGPHGRDHGATASSVAKLLTLLHTGRLVGRDESSEMRGLLDKATEWFATALPADPSTESIGKIGYQFKGAPMHEGAIITRRVGAKTIRYVAVGLNASWSSGALFKLIDKLDECIVTRHVRPG